jgi:hypothetical protein
MQAVKAVLIPYESTSRVLSLLESFKTMVNLCIQTGLEKNLTSRFNLQGEVYHQLGAFGLHSWYTLSAVEVATAILKNYRKAKRRRQGARVPRASTYQGFLRLGTGTLKGVDGFKLNTPMTGGFARRS